MYYSSISKLYRNLFSYVDTIEISHEYFLRLFNYRDLENFSRNFYQEWILYIAILTIITLGAFRILWLKQVGLGACNIKDNKYKN